MLGLCLCGRPARTAEKEERVSKLGTSSIEANSRGDEDEVAQSCDRRSSVHHNLHATAGAPANSLTESSPSFSSSKSRRKHEKRTATLQELSSKYRRGVFDPKNPTGRLKTKNAERKNSNSTPSPKTPDETEPVRRGSLGRTETESCITSSDSGEKDEKNIFSTRSTLSAGTSGRPQPISELQSILGVQDLGSPRATHSATQSATHSDQYAQSVASLDRTNSALHSSASRRSTASRRSGLEQVSPSPKSPRAEDGQSLRERRSSKDGNGSKLHRSVSQTVRQSLMRQQSFGTPIAISRQIIEPYRQTKSANGPWSLEDHPYYKVLGSLTGGSSANILVCLDERTKEKVVVKMLSRGVSTSKAAEREIATLRLCAMHPFIIHLREVFLTRSHLALAMDFAEGGNLATYIEMYQSSKTGKGISEERAKLIFQQIMVAIEFCHNMGFANRDIKLDNVLLVPSGEDKAAIPTVKLSDFGFSKDEYVDSICKTACGTPECVAPEVLTGGLYDGKFSDIWSSGVLLYAMLTGNYPFSRPADKGLEADTALKKLFARIMNAKFAMPQHISKEAQDILQQMLTVDPEQRISIGDVLQHPFFTNNHKKSKALSVNNSLLQVPDTMLIGFSRQTDDQIAQILKQASRAPAPYTGQN